MNVSFNPQAGNSRAAAHRPSSAGAPQQTQTQGAPGGDDGVEIRLSAQAQQLLSAQTAGKARAETPSTQAAVFLAGAAATSETGGAQQPFGQIVRTFTPGHLKQAAAAAAAAQTAGTSEVAGDETATDPTAVQDDSGVVEEIVESDGSDVAALPVDAESGETATETDIAASTSDVGELLDEGEATEDPAVEEAVTEETAPESSGAEADVVEELLDDDAAAEETTVAGGDLVDELLDELLDDGSEETVA